MSNSARAQKLLALVDLVASASQTVIQEWEKADTTSDTGLPSFELYNAQRTIIGACGAFSELVNNPHHRLLEVSAGYFESRALHIAVEHRIAEVLATVDQSQGMHVKDLAAKIGINVQKLERIMRTLCSAHIFAEVQDNHFANNSISASLVNDEPFRAYLVTHAMDIYTASEKLPDVLRDPVKGNSTAVTCTAFTEAHNTNLSRWDWLEEKVTLPDGTVGPRPHLEIFGLAMIGGGRIMGTPVYYDYPWASLGEGTVVDVGGGVGGMSLDLSRKYPKLKFVVQDRPAVIEQAKGIWQKENPDALANRVTLMPHNFFEENPVKGAAAYLLRYIIHDWEDDRCVDILRGIRVSMRPSSRILIADQVMNTTLGCPEIAPAPAPLPANYGIATRFAHERDLDMLALINGVERTPAQFRSLAARSGLEVARIWECRGIISVVEMRLPSSSI